MSPYYDIMRKLFILLAPVLLAGTSLLAQTSIELIPSGGYTFPDQVNFYDTYGRIEGVANWGGSLQFNVNRNFGIELMYNRMDAKSGLYRYSNTTQAPISQQQLGINYIMAGPVQSFGFPGSPVHLFFGGMLGAAIFSPSPTDYSSNTKFAWGLQGGTNGSVSPRFGIRLKAQLLSPVDGAGGSFYFGNVGYGAGVSTYSSVYQFGFSAGLIIGMGRILPTPRPRPAVQYHRPPPPRYYYYRYP